MIVEKAGTLGFCFGVKRAINIVERVTRERGGIETLGPLVHNQQVLQELAGIGVRVAKEVNDIQGDTVVISAHGIGQQIEAEIRARHIEMIDTTCPFVRRLQLAARKLAESGFFVVIYGASDHTEVKATLGWANNWVSFPRRPAYQPILPNLSRTLSIIRSPGTRSSGLLIPYATIFENARQPPSS